MKFPAAKKTVSGSLRHAIYNNGIHGLSISLVPFLFIRAFSLA